MRQVDNPEPSLTMVSVPAREAGARAMAMLDRLIEGDSVAPQQVVLDVELIRTFQLRPALTQKRNDTADVTSVANPDERSVDPRGSYSNSWQQLIAQFHGLVAEVGLDT